MTTASGYDADVIIAGAGIPGATLALSLAQAGLKPILIAAGKTYQTWSPKFVKRKVEWCRPLAKQQ